VRSSFFLTMRLLFFFLSIWWGLSLKAIGTDSIVINIDTSKVEGYINKHLYGFLLEHLYHSVSNGIWGECVWNRSFEERLADGDWTIDYQGRIFLKSRGRQQSLFHIAQGQDYKVTLEMRRLSGNGDIIVGVRDQYREKMLTNRIYFRSGKQHQRLECHTGWIWHTPKTREKSFMVQQRASDSWNKVEIECKYELVTVWLNGKILFCQTIENCPKDGAVAIGAEDCEVAFRRVRVTDRAGHIIPVNLNLIRHWNQIGYGESSVCHDALNDHTALMVRNIGKWAGVEQPSKYYVRENDLLQGSLFLKGNVDQVFVRLLKDNKVLSEQKLSDITSEWQEKQVTLPVKQDCRGVSLQILNRGEGYFCVDQVSLMHQSSIDSGGFRRELTSAIKAIGPTMLRWPGGSFSEHYHFEHGIGKQFERIGIQRWDDYDPLSFGTDEFLDFCQQIGAEPVIVVPIGYHNYAGYAPDKDGHEDWLQRALDWMDYCKDRVKYWEIDNEVWKMNPHLYAQLVRMFSIAMKKRSPSAKIIACGCGRLGAEGVGLDSIMIHDVGEYIDYISPHYYQTLDKFGTDGVEEYGRYLDKLAEWIKSSKNPSMRIYLSEWNLDGVDMRTGLFAGGFLNRLECTPYVEMAAPALFLRHLSAPAWNNAFINFDQDRWFGAPNYVVMKLWRDNYLPYRIGLAGETGVLNIVATMSVDGKQKCLKIVNPESRPVNLKVRGGKKYGSAKWQIVKASTLGDQNTLAEPEKIHVESGQVGFEKENVSIVIPAYSASVLSFSYDQY